MWLKCNRLVLNSILSLFHLSLILFLAGMGASLSQPLPVTVGECRGLVKTLVCGMKTITWGVGSCKIPNSSVDFCKYKISNDLLQTSTVYRGVLISGCWNRGVPLYTEVSLFQGVGIEEFHCIQRCPHFKGLE